MHYVYMSLSPSARVGQPLGDVALPPYRDVAVHGDLRWKTTLENTSVDRGARHSRPTLDFLNPNMIVAHMPGALKLELIWLRRHICLRPLNRPWDYPAAGFYDLIEVLKVEEYPVGRPNGIIKWPDRIQRAAGKKGTKVISLPRLDGKRRRATSPYGSGESPYTTCSQQLSKQARSRADGATILRIARSVKFERGDNLSG
jgi:hypothetical protein